MVTVLKNNKGFTLIELLAVITILILIMSIAMPSITSLLKRTNTKLSKEKEHIYLSAAQEYVEDNYNSITSTSCYITLSTLYSKGYLTKNSYYLSDNKTAPGCIILTKIITIRILIKLLQLVMNV